jgi:hypothetical protein
MVYDFNEVAEILRISLGMPETLARNWTMGKPLKIVGSDSTGSKNLFSENDVFKFGIAYELRKAGIETDELKKIYESLPGDLNKILWLIITPKGHEFLVSRGKKEPKETVWLTVNVEQLVSQLEKEIQKIPESRKSKAEEKQKRGEQ